MTDFRTKLTQLGPGEFLDVVGDVVREQTRRSNNKSPVEMTDAEHRAWAATQIKLAEQAKAEAARKAAEDAAE
jgi:phage terminase small subunit